MSTFGAPRRPAVKGPRPEGSWSAAVERARESWDRLAGGPSGLCVHGWATAERCSAGCKLPRYSDTAAAAILATALGLWADTAAALDE